MHIPRHQLQSIKPLSNILQLNFKIDLGDKKILCTPQLLRRIWKLQLTQFSRLSNLLLDDAGNVCQCMMVLPRSYFLMCSGYTLMLSGFHSGRNRLNCQLQHKVWLDRLLNVED
jgi:hypothetical protein